MRCHLGVFVAVVAALGSVSVEAATVGPRTLVGFTFHWDFINSQADAERLLAFASGQGAQVLNVVPPPHIWEQPESLATLRWLFAETRRRGIAISLNRIDGSSFAAAPAARRNWLYTNILTEPAVLPSGKATPAYFLATVGNRAFERWLLEETAYYAEHFGRERNLVSFSVGGFNEPFVSQRGSLLCWDDDTGSYELAQYTPGGLAVWHAFLERRFGDITAIDGRYGTAFRRLDAVPMPRNEHDPAFARADLAYVDLVASVNDWFLTQLTACQDAWHRRAGSGVPFVLQFNGGMPEKLEKGRPAFAALDLGEWMIRADALGLSLYTNCGYPDWGQASARAMVNLLRLAPLLGKPVFVLESGSECDGAVADAAQFAFLARAARSLAPRVFIYEFLKMSYCEEFSTRAGKLLGNDWQPDAGAVRSMRTLLSAAKAPDPAGPLTWVLATSVEGADTADLGRRLELMRRAMVEPVALLPRAALDRLRPGARLVVPDGTPRGETCGLAARGIDVEAASVFLGRAAPPAPSLPGPSGRPRR